MDATQWLAGYRENLARTAAGAQEASESLRQAGASATSPRHEVVVTVGPGGALEDLRLTPGARALEAEQLARLILATARQAQRAAGARVAEIMTGYVGEGPALDLVRQYLPESDVDSRARVAAPADNRDDDDYFENPPEISQ